MTVIRLVQPHGNKSQQVQNLLTRNHHNKYGLYMPKQEIS
jgi:hypothetical protein